MASSEGQQQKKNDSDESLKLAVAMALLRSKLLPKPPPPPPPPSSFPTPSHSDAQKWKRKAKERKLEILRLKEDLKEAEDGSLNDLFPDTASCKCYFFDRLGKLSPTLSANGYDQRFNDVLRRRFLRQVRLRERRRKWSDGSAQGQRISEYNIEYEPEQLRASVDFLVELCETVSSLQDTNFANWSHQAVDFILAAIKNISSIGKHMEHVEGVVSSLIMRLCKRMCTTLQGNEEDHFNTDVQFYVQHLLRKLGSEPYIGHRLILAVSQRISVLAEKLLFIDPFDEAFPNMHNCLYIMVQLIEFLVSDYLVTWSNTEVFDSRLCEEWMMSMLHARKGLELLESRNGIYAVYMDRVMGVLAKQVGQIPSIQKLNPEILASVFR